MTRTPTLERTLKLTLTWLRLTTRFVGHTRTGKTGNHQILRKTHNQVGEILERRGNRRGALDAYRRSLEIEWNQPPIIEIRARLEQQAK